MSQPTHFDATARLAPNHIHLWLTEQRGIKTNTFLRKVLSHYLPLHPSQIQFARTPNGKPFLKNRKLKDRRFNDLQFNISHSHGKIVCAVSHGLLLGVDIENIHRKNKIEEIAERYFHASEIKALQSIKNEEEKRNLFFTLWTCKEAYIKAIGKTIGTASLDAVRFSRENDRVKPQFPLPVQQRWSFHITPVDDLLITVARAQRPWQATTKSQISLFVSS